MADPVAAARAKIAQLKSEISELEHFLKMYERLSDSAPTSSSVAAPARETGVDAKGRGNVTVQLSVDNVGSGSRGDAESPSRDSRRRPPGAPKPGDIASLMERIIREVGRPMTRGEIVAALEARDVIVPYEDKSRYVGTIAWRNKGLFENIEGRGYWLRGEPMPALTIPDAPDIRRRRDIIGDWPEDQDDPKSGLFA